MAGEYMSTLYGQAAAAKLSKRIAMMDPKKRPWIIEVAQVDSHDHFRLRTPCGGLVHNGVIDEIIMRHEEFLDFAHRLNAHLVIGPVTRHIMPYGLGSNEVMALLDAHRIPYESSVSSRKDPEAQEQPRVWTPTDREALAKAKAYERARWGGDPSSEIRRLARRQGMEIL